MKRFFESLIGVAAASALVAGCAPVEESEAPQDPAATTAAADQDGRACFYPRNLTGFRNAPDGPDGERRIYVDVGASDTFLFELMTDCRDLRFARSIAFDTTTGVGRVCSGLEVDVIVPDPTLGPQRCPVTMIRRLGPGEEGTRARAN
ncbi:MAG: DUF6491 family protein [Erythrobacter sp.]|jgi:hypothetical protein|nr:DUF6491 family protein [Erythrobacter sp.]